MINDLLGIGASSLTIAQMGSRAVVVYVVALMMVRVVGDRRFAGKYAAIDIVLSITLGATLSNAIGSEAFFPTLAAGFVLVAMHWLTATVAYHIPATESWLKGSPRTLIRNGQTKNSALAASSLTQQDLEMVLRSQGNPTHVQDIVLAVLEPNGDITILDQLPANDNEV